MIFGKQGLPLEASPNTFFLISYNVMDAQSLEVGGRSVVALHIAAIHQWHYELLTLLTYQWPYKLFDIRITSGVVFYEGEWQPCFVGR